PCRGTRPRGGGDDRGDGRRAAGTRPADDHPVPGGGGSAGGELLLEVRPVDAGEGGLLVADGRTRGLRDLPCGDRRRQRWEPRTVGVTEVEVAGGGADAPGEPLQVGGPRVLPSWRGRPGGARVPDE